MDPRSKVPVAAIWLGYAGALPFVAGAAALLIGPQSLRPFAAATLMNYGAIILSFMGGVHWGAAIMRQDNEFGALGRSVAPALVAFLAIMLGGAVGLAILAIGFGGLLYYDELETRGGRAPQWYPKLRRPLTAIVVSSLVVGLVA